MGREIERKFLVRHDGWRDHVIGSVGIRQAYLGRTGNLSIRVRVRDDGAAALTFKSAAKTLSRAEFEYPVPAAEAEALILLAEAAVLVKRRHEVVAGGLKWEIDVFSGRHLGLILAEVELSDAAQEVPLPAWLGEEVTGDPRYYNEALAGA